MARYIDLDKLLKGLEDELKDKNPDDIAYLVFKLFIGRLSKEPTADVVPKSEVERLTIEFEAMRTAANSYKMHYENLAREIFEEIEEALFNNHDLDLHSDYPTPHYYEELKDDIAELKKKYTEVNNEKSDNNP